MNKNNVDLTSEEKKYYVCVKPGISKSQQLEESLKSKVVNIFLLNPKTWQYQLGMFLKLNTGKRRSQRCRKSVLCRKVYIGSWKNGCKKEVHQRSTASFSPLVCCQVLSNIRKIVSIIHMLGKKEDKPYLFYDFENPSVKSVE